MPKVNMESLRTFEGNAKQGDLPKIKKSLEKLGQYKPIVVNLGTKTGRPMEILAGNNTYAAALELGWTEIEIHEVDVDQDEAVQINVLDNKLSELGTYDEKALAAQLTSLTDFEITGYTPGDMDLLLRNTASMADAFISGMNQGIDQTPAAVTTSPVAQVPQFSASEQAPVSQVESTSTPPADPFQSETDNVSRETSAPSVENQQTPAASFPAPPQVDPTPYFTVSYTVTGEQREVLQQAIRRAQQKTAAPTSALALLAICEAYQ